MEAHIEHRAARRRRTRHSVRLDGRHILCAQRFRRGGSGRLRHWHAPAGRGSYAGDVHCIRGRRHRRAKRRRRQPRAGEGNLQERPASRHRRDAGLTALAQWRPELWLGAFTKDPETIAVGALFLRMISLNLVAQGVIYVCSSMFQGLGNTRPALLSSGARLIMYGLPLVWLSARPGFRIEQAWYLSIATTTLQAAFSLWLLRLEFRKRLVPRVP